MSLRMFIYANVGAKTDKVCFEYFSMIFCDFGEDFVCNDVDGEQPISNMIAGVTMVILCLLCILV